jgi:hypothetical protein
VNLSIRAASLNKARSRLLWSDSAALAVFGRKNKEKFKKV